jgi:hypothetical protein
VKVSTAMCPGAVARYSSQMRRKQNPIQASRITVSATAGFDWRSVAWIASSARAVLAGAGRPTRMASPVRPARPATRPSAHAAVGIHLRGYLGKRAPGLRRNIRPSSSRSFSADSTPVL